MRIGDIIQAARIKYGPKHNTSIRNYILANTDLVGTLATPLAPVVNAAVATKPVRMIMDKVMGIDHRRIFPKYSHGTFESWYRRHAGGAAGVVRASGLVFPRLLRQLQQPAAGQGYDPHNECAGLRRAASG